MSLFNNLERLHRSGRFQREDFITEIVVQVLKDSPELTLEWLRSLGVTDLRKADYVKVDPQVTFSKLAGHDKDSRPDISILLTDAGQTELILIESKVDSSQGETQLQRYADHLAAEKQLKALKKVSLVFITRDYEAATIALAAPDPSFIFHVTRWYKFYNKLKAHTEKNSDGLAKQLKLFLEENRMSLGHQFRSTDIVALENFLSAKALMNETLEGEVYKKMNEVVGSVWNPTHHLDKGLREEHRYVIRTNECLVGFWFPYANPDQSVSVGAEIWSDPSSKNHKETIEGFRSWLAIAGTSWLAEQLDDETGWCAIGTGKPIQAFMSGDDHVQAIKAYFLNLIDEVARFKNAYPGLK